LMCSHYLLLSPVLAYYFRVRAFYNSKLDTQNADCFFLRPAEFRVPYSVFYLRTLCEYVTYIGSTHNMRLVTVSRWAYYFRVRYMSYAAHNIQFVKASKSSVLFSSTPALQLTIRNCFFRFLPVGSVSYFAASGITYYFRVRHLCFTNDLWTDNRMSWLRSPGRCLRTVCSFRVRAYLSWQKHWKITA
jgi:hypothetical protein